MLAVIRKRAMCFPGNLPSWTVANPAATRQAQIFDCLPSEVFDPQWAAPELGLSSDAADLMSAGGASRPRMKLYLRMPKRFCPLPPAIAFPAS
jgi:hypothetical protein